LSKESYFNFLVVFSLIFALTTITEFLAYAISPSLRDVVTLYLQNVVQTPNFYSPHVQYPLIGEYTKPWGPMLDASGNGSFLAVLFCFVYERALSVKTKFIFISTFIILLAVFMSGSKSAYLMVIIYFFMKNIIWFFIKPTLINVTVLFVSPFLLVATLASFATFFFTQEELLFYIDAFIFYPFANLYDGFILNGPLILFGMGQESSANKIIGTGEVDLFNSMVRYGFLFTIIFTCILFWLAVKCVKTSPEFSALFIMFIISMNHYQVAFKFPASIIMFMSIAVYLNERDKNKIKGVI
jgi:hypothetical protein